VICTWWSCVTRTRVGLEINVLGPRGGSRIRLLGALFAHSRDIKIYMVEVLLVQLLTSLGLPSHDAATTPPPLVKLQNSFTAQLSIWGPRFHKQPVPSPSYRGK
jgi:hypothetical protein